MALFENLNLRPLLLSSGKTCISRALGDQSSMIRRVICERLCYVNWNIPYVKDLVERLRRDKGMRSTCGYRDKTPTEAHFSHMKKRIGAEGFKATEVWLRHEALKLRESQPLSAVSSLGSLRGRH